MSRDKRARILAGVDAVDMVGRADEFARLVSHSTGGDGLALHAAPTVGTSELLRQVYDHLFFSQQNTIPFYFELRPQDEDRVATASRFLREFLLQTVAFRRQEPRIMFGGLTAPEIAELAAREDRRWIGRLVDTYLAGPGTADETAFVHTCFSAPVRAAAASARPFVMIDNIHPEVGEAGHFTELGTTYSHARLPYVFAGPRRFLYAVTSLPTMPLMAFGFEAASMFVERLAGRLGVAINEQTRDLIAVQLGCNAGHMTSLVTAAANAGVGLDSFNAVEQVYTDQVFGGRISNYFDGIISRSHADAFIPRLARLIDAPGGRVPLAKFGRELKTGLASLHQHEIVSVSSGSVQIDRSNLALCDHIRGRARLEVDGAPRALVVGEALAANIKRAPRLMASHYRRTHALDLLGLMRAFDGKHVSPALIDYARFKAEFKVADDDKILKAVKEDNKKVRLPQIVFSARTAAFYPQIGEICEPERSAVGLGSSSDKHEFAWIAAEIDSKLEATRELAEFWCDRLEMAAVNCNFDRYRIWLVSPEGFDDDALAALAERNAFGASRKQAEILARVLNVPASPDRSDGDEYELIIPMGSDTEMIAAHTVEEIAKRHGFAARAVNQIKTALVEACINAAEHSLSPDRKIHQKFVVNGNNLSITISNRGVRLADRPNPDPAAANQRRGWGLKLIQSLMDEVTFHETDDGTEITMVKYREKTK